MKSIELPTGFVQPDYAGNTVANIPATVSSLLKVPFNGLPPLRSELWNGLGQDVSRVVLILLDSFGRNLFLRNQSGLEQITREAAVVGKISSVFPSTTVAALSSLWTGFAPAQHGLVGLRLFFPEFGVLGQLIRFSPNLASYPDALIDAGIDPESFLAVPGFAEQLDMAGVASWSLKGNHLLNSALSKMHNRGISGEIGIVTAADMFVQLKNLLEQTVEKKLYVNCYWPSLDSLSHVYGPLHDIVSAELQMIAGLLKRYLFDELSPSARRGTVVFITGDHGQVEVPPEQQIALTEHPELKENLLMRPVGEPRSPYFYAKQGKKATVLRYLQEELTEAMVAWDANDALKSELIGPPPFAPDTAQRVGDIVATMRDSHLLLTDSEQKKAHRMKGRHGGLTASEMEIAWLAFRLD